MTKFYRDTWVEIDMDALIYNYKQITQLRPNQDMIAVIKANAYGHGDIQIAKLFAELGVAYLAVSSLDEAIKLRKYEIQTPIIVLAPVKISDVNLAAEFDITIVAYDEQWVDELAKTHLRWQLKLHLEVETGMNRTGLHDVMKSYQKLSQIDNVIPEGIYTHIASADSNRRSVAEQLAAFSQIQKSFKSGTFKYVHVANTATMMQFELDGINAHRVGLGLYGINPDDDFIKTDLDLRPAFSLYARLTQVSKLRQGDAVSYGGSFVAPCEMHVGTMSIGYADGWLRMNQGRSVLIKGQECEIIGRVCMDQMMVKLPSADFEMGDVVTLIGEQLPASRVAREQGTIAYEILTLISDRIPRIYKKNGAVIDCNLGRFGG
jgi:alanine racemase